MYPLYTESTDTGFIQACDAFLNDKVRRIQWWEEHRFAKDRKEFFRVPPVDGKDNPGKAFSFYTLPDSTIIGFFKERWVTYSHNMGDTWSQPIQCNTLTYKGAKIWGQRLDNGQYALVYNPTNSMARIPTKMRTCASVRYLKNKLPSKMPIRAAGSKITRLRLSQLFR